MREAAFLEHLALSSNVAASERVAKLTPGTAYRQKRRDAEFAGRWELALREGYGRLEAAMLDRAINGTPVTITMKDGSKKETVEYPERLQMHLYNAHRTTVMSASEAAAAGSARERLAAKLAEIHNAATRWNKALLDNAARPSGALVYEPGEPGATLTAEQLDRLRAEMEASFAGAGNAGRPMLLEGGLKWQALSLTPADMDFINLKSAAAREIALAFGVPPMLLGLPGDNTYAIIPRPTARCGG